MDTTRTTNNIILYFLVSSIRRRPLYTYVIMLNRVPAKHHVMRDPYCNCDLVFTVHLSIVLHSISLRWPQDPQAHSLSPFFFIFFYYYLTMDVQSIYSYERHYAKWDDVGNKLRIRLDGL